MKNLTLTAEVSSDIKNFIQDKKLVESLVNSFGSPLNIVFQKQIKRNYSSFKKVCESNEVMCRLFYAHKTNKSLALLRSARQAGASLDVA